MRRTRVWARLLGSQRVVVEDVQNGSEHEIVVAVRREQDRRVFAGVVAVSRSGASKIAAVFAGVPARALTRVRGCWSTRRSRLSRSCACRVAHGRRDLRTLATRRSARQAPDALRVPQPSCANRPLDALARRALPSTPPVKSAFTDPRKRQETRKRLAVLCRCIASAASKRAASAHTLAALRFCRAWPLRASAVANAVTALIGRCSEAVLEAQQALARFHVGEASRRPSVVIDEGDDPTARSISALGPLMNSARSQGLLASSPCAASSSAHARATFSRTSANRVRCSGRRWPRPCARSAPSP